MSETPNRFCVLCQLWHEGPCKTKYHSMEDTLYIFCESCGDSTYIQKDEVEKDRAGTGIVYFREDHAYRPSDFHYFCSLPCLSDYVNSNFDLSPFKTEFTLNGGENDTIKNAMPHLSDLYNRIPR